MNKENILLTFIEVEDSNDALEAVFALLIDELRKEKIDAVPKAE